MFIFNQYLVVLLNFLVICKLLMFRSKLFLLIPLVIFYFDIATSETLKQTLIDSYKYYPDINKSRLDLTNKKKDLSISKTDFLPPHIR